MRGEARLKLVVRIDKQQDGAEICMSPSSGYEMWELSH